MAKLLDEFSALDQITGAAEITGAPMMMRRARINPPPSPRTPLSPRPTSQTALTAAHNDLDAHSSAMHGSPVMTARAVMSASAHPPPMPPLPSTIRAIASTPMRRAVLRPPQSPDSPRLDRTHPQVSTAISAVSQHIASAHGLPADDPAILDSAHDVVSRVALSAPSTSAALTAMATPAVASALAASVTSPAYQASESSQTQDEVSHSPLSFQPESGYVNPSNYDNSRNSISRQSSSQPSYPSNARSKGTTMASLENRPDRQFLQPLGFLQLAVAAGATPDITSKPQGAAFKPIRLVVISSIAAFFSLLNVRIGTDSQFVGTTEVPCQTYSENAVGVAMELGTAQSGIDITLSVKNFDAAVHDFRAAMLGIVFK